MNKWGVRNVPIKVLEWGSFEESRKILDGRKHVRHADHVLPWSRWPNDAIENLVLTDMPEGRWVAEVTVEMRMMNRPGGWRWMEATVSNAVDGGVSGGVVIALRDVHERKRAEDAPAREPGGPERG